MLRALVEEECRARDESRPAAASSRRVSRCSRISPASTPTHVLPVLRRLLGKSPVIVGPGPDRTAATAALVQDYPNMCLALDLVRGDWRGPLRFAPGAHAAARVGDPRALDGGPGMPLERLLVLSGAEAPTPARAVCLLAAGDPRKWEAWMPAIVGLLVGWKVVTFLAARRYIVHGRHRERDPGRDQLSRERRLRGGLKGTASARFSE
jgi:hypothetical protein